MNILFLWQTIGWLFSSLVGNGSFIGFLDGRLLFCLLGRSVVRFVLCFIFSFLEYLVKSLMCSLVD